MRTAAAALLALAVGLGAGACDGKNKPFVRAFQSTSRTQLIGGIAAIGDVGDYVVENDQVRFVILAGHGSPGPGLFGGSLADADLQRPEPEFRNGQGLDSLSEIFPMANLATPNPEKTDIAIEEDGQDGTQAVLRVRAAADNYMKALETLKQGFGVPMDITLTTRYRLVPGSRVLEIETALEFDNNDGQRQNLLMPGLTAPPNIFGTILRVPGKPYGTAPGAVAGDFLFYGNKTDVFTPGYGFDVDRKLREIFNGGCDSVNVPLGVDALAAEGDRVSYAYASGDENGGRTYVPLFAASFTAVISNQFQCDSSVPCLGDKRLTYKRYFAVGDGDAASALAAIYKQKNVATGRLEGHLYDRKSGEAVSGARVVVLRDPGAAAVSDASLAHDDVDGLLSKIYDENRRASRVPCADPDPLACARCAPEIDAYGEPGIVTSMKTDRGTDRVLDGDFAASLRPGSYVVLARSRERPNTRPVRVTIRPDVTAQLNLRIDPPALLEVHLTDQTGRASPGKVTIGRCLPQCVHDADCGDGATCDAAQRRCFPKNHCADGSCAPYETCDGASCRCDAHTALDVALGDPLMPDNIVTTGFAGVDGVVKFRVRPGQYEFIASRGLEYDLDRQRVTLEPDRPMTRDAAVHRVVDTSGWISADFHVHGINSHDAYVRHEARVLSMMGEGIELLSSSDHDAITDFAPAVRALGAEPFIKTQVGLETTTIEMGHFIGEPLRYDLLAEGRGVFGKTGGAFDWNGLPPGPTSFCDTNNDGLLDPGAERLVARGDPTHRCAGDPVVDDPGIFGRLRDLGLFDPKKTVITVPHPRDGFFGYFDQFSLDPYSLKLGTSLLEILNPLIKPDTFSTEFDAVELFNGKRLDFVRTPTIAEIGGFGAELKALRAEQRPNDELEQRTGEISDRWVRRILERTPEEQHTLITTTGQVACTATACSALGTCGRGQVCDAATNSCLQECNQSHLCEPATGTCDTTTGVCRRDPGEPCTDHRGVVDDWFRMLNAGARFTGLGNSDTHTLLSNESGIPRNFVRSHTDEPRAIDIGEIAENMLAHQVETTYGPFVRMDANGIDIGGTLEKPAGPVRLHVMVESPLWFDVDRLEVYRNGELWKVVEAGRQQTQPACSTIDELPNRSIVHFDCTFVDQPDRDVWYVAIALGLRGKDLRPIYSSVPILSLEIGDITGRAFGAFGLAVGKPEIPRQTPVLPMAVTNPIWVDLQGDGFQPPTELDPTSPFAPKGSLSQPLASAALTAPLLPDEDTRDDLRGRRLVAAMHRRLQQAFESMHHRPVGLDER